MDTSKLLEDNRSHIILSTFIWFFEMLPNGVKGDSWEKLLNALKLYHQGQTSLHSGYIGRIYDKDFDCDLFTSTQIKSPHLFWHYNIQNFGIVVDRKITGVVIPVFNVKGVSFSEHGVSFSENLDGFMVHQKREVEHLVNVTASTYNLRTLVVVLRHPNATMPYEDFNQLAWWENGFINPTRRMTEEKLAEIRNHQQKLIKGIEYDHNTLEKLPADITDYFGLES